MSNHRYMLPLQQWRLTRKVGNKALNQHRLYLKGIRVPKTYICTWEAYKEYKKNGQKLLQVLKTELTEIIDPNKTYAVRSSASMEDRFEHSFAGQFKSILHVRGLEDVLDSIQTVWESANTPEVQTYVERHGIESDELLMAVMVQEMIQAVFSGVAFSKNPVTGADEVIVEAVTGNGNQLVQDGITPQRWVNKWGYWREKPAESTIPQELIDSIITGTKVIAKKLHHNVDLEWVWNGSSLYWVQEREITSLPQGNLYSNYIPREMLPGMIKPLVFSINIPLVNSVWISWIKEIIRDLDIKPEDLAKSFYYRVYFNMGKLGDIFEGMGFPRESVEMLMGYLPKGAGRASFKPSPRTFILIPRMILFFIDKWNFGQKLRNEMPNLQKHILQTPYQNLEKLSESELLKAIENHFKLMQKTTYYNVLGPMLMGMYNRSLQSQLGKKGVEFKNFDLTEGMTDILEYDPSTHLQRLNDQFRSFSPEVQEQIKNSTFSDLMKLDSLNPFPQEVERFIQRFGYLSDNGNDFTAIPWREKADTILNLVTSYQKSEETVNQKIHYSDLKRSHKVNWMHGLLYRRAREFRLLREQISGLYTHGYGLFRYYFLALGHHFVFRNIIDNPEDIYYFTFDEVKLLIQGNSTIDHHREKVAKHKADMERFRSIQLPVVIYGDEEPCVKTGDAEVLTGVATSLGTYTGTISVVKGIDDFSKVSDGDVLVIPYSDISWTPLFARAKAVVAESGGLLSHSSIVAREYNIPAVVSVEGATNLADGTLVTVDGTKGEVLIHNNH